MGELSYVQRCVVPTIEFVKDMCKEGLIEKIIGQDIIISLLEYDSKSYEVTLFLQELIDTNNLN